MISLFEKPRAVVRRKADGTASADLAGSLTQWNMPSMVDLSEAKDWAGKALA